MKAIVVVGEQFIWGGKPVSTGKAIDAKR